LPQCKKVNIKQQEIRGFSAVSLSKKLNSEISIGDAQNRQKRKPSPVGEGGSRRLTDEVFTDKL